MQLTPIHNNYAIANASHGYNLGLEVMVWRQSCDVLEMYLGHTGQHLGLVLVSGHDIQSFGYDIWGLVQCCLLRSPGKVQRLAFVTG